MQERQFQQQRQQFYLFVMRQILKIAQQLKAAGIQLEDIIPQALLLHKHNHQYTIKVLYDERQKRYQKIKQGIKVFASPLKVRQKILLEEEYSELHSNVSADEPASSDQQELVFQMGLFMLDLCYQYELSRSEPFAKDAPLMRNTLSHKSYIVFKDSSTAALNSGLVDKKAGYLCGIDGSFMRRLVVVIGKMIVQPEVRIRWEQLTQQIDALAKQLDMDKQKQNKQNDESSNKKQDDNKEITKYGNKEITKYGNKEIIEYGDEQIVEYRQQQRQIRQQEQTYGSRKQNIISQTTVATISTNIKQINHITQSQNIYQQQQISQKVNPVIPRSRLLNQIQSHKDLHTKLQNFIIQLQKIKNSIHKQYYDKSEYFGQVDSINFKRNGLGIYVYIQGDIYFGMWQQNSLVEGTYVFKNGQCFEGVVKAGKQGYGKYYYSNGNIYQGQWKNDLKNGKGKMSYPNGDTYEGMWINGKKNGQGIYYYSNATVYEGNFSNGKKKGFGVITFPNKTKIQAVWNQTHIQGPGKVYYSNGNYFQGTYSVSQKQGQGLYNWQDAQYCGGFEKDAMQGYAKIKFSQFEYYQGKIKNGKRYGSGTYRYANGDEFKGEWKNDEKIYGFYRFKDGATFEGRFKSNNISYGVMVYQNGQSYEGEFRDGERHGSGSYRDVMKEVLFEGSWQRDQFVSSF